MTSCQKDSKTQSITHQVIKSVTGWRLKPCSDDSVSGLLEASCVSYTWIGQWLWIFLREKKALKCNKSLKRLRRHETLQVLASSTLFCLWPGEWFSRMEIAWCNCSFHGACACGPARSSIRRLARGLLVQACGHDSCSHEALQMATQSVPRCKFICFWTSKQLDVLRIMVDIVGWPPSRW